MSKVSEKREEIGNKYADVVNDLATKYGVDLGVGLDHLLAIGKARQLGEEPLYSTDIEFDEEEFQKEFEEYDALSEEALNN